MNKYRESLDCITSSVCENCNCNSDVGCQGCDILESKQVLEELIEKKTPKKVIKLDKQEYGYTHQCPCCKQLVGTVVYNIETRMITDIEKDDYCPHCGQKIDWSDEK